MQEEIEQKSVTLMINGTKFSLRTLKSAALKLLAHRQNPSAPGVKHHGRQTVRQLVGQNQGVSNIELSGQDLKEFQRITRRYGVDYAIRKVGGDKPRVLVFFKARDSDALTAALKELASTKARTSFRSPTVGKSEGTDGKDHRENPKQGAEPMSKRKKHTFTLSEAAKKELVLNLPYCMIGLYATKLGQAWRMAEGTNLSEKLLHLGDGFASAFASSLPSFHPADLLVGLFAGLLFRLAVYLKSKDAKKFRKGREYGSACWGTRKDIEPFIAPVFKNNILLTQTERLTMNSRPKDPRTARNKNVLVIGGSGSGKTRYLLKPNLMQCHSSYVITDPKGSLLIECGHLLEKKKYQIRFFNTINFKKSLHYNPFHYIHSEKDILKLANVLITNTDGGQKSGDPFWRNAEMLLYCALMGYIFYEAPPHEQNFNTLVAMINAMEVREDDDNFKNPVDLLFDALEEKDPDHFAVRQYHKYKLAAGVVCFKRLLNQLIRKPLKTHSL
jgi:hypothetical protein